MVSPWVRGGKSLFETDFPGGRTYASLAFNSLSLYPIGLSCCHPFLGGPDLASSPLHPHPRRAPPNPCTLTFHLGLTLGHSCSPLYVARARRAWHLRRKGGGYFPCLGRDRVATDSVTFDTHPLSAGQTPHAHASHALYYCQAVPIEGPVAVKDVREKRRPWMAPVKNRTVSALRT